MVEDKVMINQEQQSVPVRGQGVIKVSYSTGLILAGIIFVASLFSGWLNQVRDVSGIQENHKALAAIVAKDTERITVMEQCVLAARSDIGEIKTDMKDMNRHLLGITGALKKEIKDR